MQDKLGSYLKHQLSYRPEIYCIGAAPGFVTGDQNRHSDVGRSIFCRVDIPSFCTTSDLVATILERAPIASIDFALRARATAGQGRVRGERDKTEGVQDHC
jgi:hypothetical protein